MSNIKQISLDDTIALHSRLISRSGGMDGSITESDLLDWITNHI